MSDNIRYLPSHLAAQKDVREALPKGGGSGYDGGMEARVAKLEALAESTDRRLTTVEQDIRGLRSDQRQDFRITWGGLIAAVLALAGLMAKGFNWL